MIKSSAIIARKEEGKYCMYTGSCMTEMANFFQGFLVINGDRPK
jgi:hypothetical protein